MRAAAAATLFMGSLTWIVLRDVRRLTHALLLNSFSLRSKNDSGIL